MLYFAQQPDPVFTAILHEALEARLDQLADAQRNLTEAEDVWNAQCPQAAQCFPLPLATDTLRRLLAASRDPGTVYRITDYGWLLLYDCLKSYCEIHNETVREDGTLVPVGSYQVGPIDFDWVVDALFWDLDFLTDQSTMAHLGPAGRQQLGMSDEAFGIAQGLVPHLDELAIEVVEPAWEAAADPGPSGGAVPAYPADEDGDDRDVPAPQP